MLLVSGYLGSPALSFREAIVSHTSVMQLSFVTLGQIEYQNIHNILQL